LQAEYATGGNFISTAAGLKGPMRFMEQRHEEALIFKRLKEYFSRRKVAGLLKRSLSDNVA